MRSRCGVANSAGGVTEPIGGAGLAGGLGSTAFGSRLGPLTIGALAGLPGATGVVPTLSGVTTIVPELGPPLTGPPCEMAGPSLKIGELFGELGVDELGVLDELDELD